MCQGGGVCVRVEVRVEVCVYHCVNSIVTQVNSGSTQLVLVLAVHVPTDCCCVWVFRRAKPRLLELLPPKHMVIKTHQVSPEQKGRVESQEELAANQLIKLPLAERARLLMSHANNAGKNTPLPFPQREQGLFLYLILKKYSSAVPTGDEKPANRRTL